MTELDAKLEKLKNIIRGYDSLAVAFSGGVDSGLLLFVAHDVLADKCIAITADSELLPRRENDDAAAFCKDRGIRQLVFKANELEDPVFTANPKDRCYHCKKKIFSTMLEIASANAADSLAEGSSTDDSGDYRPGMRAIDELGVISPLRDAGLGKSEIRELSKRYGLPMWDKPSFACLASRIPYGEVISADKLLMVEKSEDFLYRQGFKQYRVRAHGNVARVELLPGDLPRALQIREEIVNALKKAGFCYVTIDLEGYKTGSMNRVLS